MREFGLSVFRRLDQLKPSSPNIQYALVLYNSIPCFCGLLNGLNQNYDLRQCPSLPFASSYLIFTCKLSCEKLAPSVFFLHLSSRPICIFVWFECSLESLLLGEMPLPSPKVLMTHLSTSFHPILSQDSIHKDYAAVFL